MGALLRTGLFFSFIGKFSNLFVQLVVNAILSRLLTPADYGVVAIVQVFIIFFQLLVSAGMGPAIIQNKNLNNRDIGILFNYSLALALILGIFFGFLGIIIADFYNNEIYKTIFCYQAITVFFSGIAIVPTAVLNKAKKFKSVNLITVAANLFSGSAGVLFALNGFGVYSLVFFALITAFITFLVSFYLAKIKIVFSADTTTLKKIIGFSVNQFLFNFINYFARNTDNILIGKYMGASALGNYSKSYQLLMLPGGILLGIINPILQPILSDYQDNETVIRNVYLKIFRFLLLLGFGLSLFLSINARPIIFLIFGTQWNNAILPFQILSLTVWIQLTLSSTGVIFQSRNKTRELLFTGILSSIILILSIVCGIFLGSLDLLALCLTVGFFINFFVSYDRVMRFALGSNLTELLHEMLLPFIISVLSMLVMVGIQKVIILSSHVNNMFVLLAINCLTFSVTFLALCYVTGELRKIISLFKDERI